MGKKLFCQLGDGTNTNKNSPVRIGTSTNWVSVSSGLSYTVAIKSDGSLWAWGNNFDGQLGDGTIIDKKTPTKIGTDTNWVSASPGRDFTVAIKRDGTLWAWGNNEFGQLGDGTNININIPTQLGIETDWASIATGGVHTVAIKSDGTLWAWGLNNSGQLGDGTNISKYTPIQIGTAANWTKVYTGNSHTIALKSDGTLWAWGLNSDGQLGDGTNISKNTPVQIGTATNWKSVSLGSIHTVALKGDGTLWAWGSNGLGQLGDGTNENKNIPVQIGSETNWQSISAGGLHTFAIKNDGSIWAWGSNTAGQLGDGTNINKNTPNRLGSETNWAFVSAGAFHSMAIKSDGSLWSWGLNNSGQLGDGTIINKNTPVQIGTGKNWKSVSGGLFHTLALREKIVPLSAPILSTPIDLTINQESSLTLEWNSVNRATNYDIQLSTDNTFATIEINANSTDTQYVASNLASSVVYYWRVRAKDDEIASNWSDIWSFTTKLQGTVLFAWGNNNNGQLGDGTDTDKNSPLIISTARNWSSVSVGTSHSLALKRDKTLWAWGLNNSGQLGDGTNTNKNTPVQIGIGTNWGNISAGYLHTLAIKTNGTLWAWGENVYGQLGDGTTINKNSLVQIGIGTNWGNISAGYLHTLAIKNDGTLWAWGNNYYGQIGDDTNIDKTSPIQIGSGTNWASVSAGAYHTVSIKSDGTLWAWGLNSDGQLGDGTNTNKNTPTQIGTGTNWSSISAGYSHTIALKSDGTVWAWGQNDNGQLGDGTNIDKNSPIQIGTSTNWLSVVGRSSHNLAIRGLHPPTLLTPTNAAENRNVSLTLDWNTLSNTESYDIQVSSDSTFATTFVSSNTTVSEKAITGLSKSTTYYWRVKGFNTGGESNWYDLWSFTTQTAQDINVNLGWNLISSYMIPGNTALEVIFDSYTDKLTILKDNDGKVYIPSYNINTIGTWSYKQGYQAYFSSATILTIIGNQVKPENETIPLKFGWNLVSYLRNTAKIAPECLTSITSDNSLLIAKNNAGQVYIPSYDINSIGNMLPGQAYRMYLNKASNLVYPANSLNKTGSGNITPMPKLLIPKFKETGNSSVALLQINAPNGDEVGVYNIKNELIGSGVVHNGYAAVTIWGDNDQTDEIDGAISTEKLKLRTYNVKNTKLNEVLLMDLTDLTNGNEISTFNYSNEAFYFAKVIVEDNSTNIKLDVNPNPANEYFEITIEGETDDATLILFSYSGKQIADLSNNLRTMSGNKIRFNSSDLTSGSYNLILSNGTNKIIKQILIVK